MKQFFKKIRKRLFERKSAKEYSKESPLKYIQKQFHAEYLSKNPRKLPGEKIWETILQENPKKICKRIFKINQRRIFELKYHIKEKKQVHCF